MTDLSTFARETIDEGSKSFALASRVLSPDARDHAVMLYAYCRYADDLVDGQTMGHGQDAGYREGQAARVATLREQTHAALLGEATDNAYYLALKAVCDRTGLPTVYIDQLIDGFQMDADRRVYRTMGDILDYSYHVAGVVGVMIAWIMGVRDAKTLDRASDLGLAFQLTNIARDVIDDARAGRVFLPEDVLAKAKAPSTPEAIANPDEWPSVFKAALELLERADIYYDSASYGVRDLPYRNAWAIETARQVYREIGRTLRKAGPEAWHGRVGTTKPQKLALAAKAAFTARGKLDPAAEPRSGFYERPA